MERRVAAEMVAEPVDMCNGVQIDRARGKLTPDAHANLLYVDRSCIPDCHRDRLRARSVPDGGKSMDRSFARNSRHTKEAFELLLPTQV